MAYKNIQCFFKNAHKPSMPSMLLAFMLGHARSAQMT